MHISDEGLVAGSVNRAELVAAYNEATDEAVRENLAAVGAEHGMYVEDGKLVDPSAPPEPERFAAAGIIGPDEVRAAEKPGRPVVNDNKAAWVEWAVANGADRDEAESYTKAELIETYGE